MGEEASMMRGRAGRSEEVSPGPSQEQETEPARATHSGGGLAARKAMHCLCKGTSLGHRIRVRRRESKDDTERT